MSINSETLFLAMGVAFFATLIGVPLLRRLLMARNVIDTPNSRSSHTQPTPRGGGVVVVLAVIAGIAILKMGAQAWPTDLFPIIIIAFLLGCVSLTDDIRNLSPGLRLLCQALAVGIALAIAPELVLTSIPVLPFWLASLITAMIWVWFINLYNFMDGIDGITGVQTVTISLGICLLGITGAISFDIVAPIAIIGVASLAFLFWNWAPAKIFLGDVGSIPLGFMLGWALLYITHEGAWVAAVIIPGYYLADATITLLKRAIRGEKVWTPHREHFYQMPVLHNVRHDLIVLRIILANAVLVCISIWVTPMDYIYALCMGSLIILGLLWHLSRLGRP